MRHLAALVTLVVALSSCNSSSQWTIPRRDGPPFAETFPDASVLLSTGDVTATRKVLAATPLPETQAHHDRLLELARKADSIDTDHLLLLTDAVAVPGRLGRDTWDDDAGVSISITTDSDGTQVVHARGQGEFSPVIDEILLIGVDKLEDRTAKSFGRIIGAAQTKETTFTISDRLLAECDDESTGAMRDIMAGIPFDSQRTEFALEVLLPRGRLEGDRQTVALESLSFDSSREELMVALYERSNEVRVATLIEHIELLSFDSSRINVTNAASPRLASIDREEMLEVMSNFSFDSSRIEALEALNDKLRLTQCSDALEIMRTSSFDSGSEEILDLLLTGSFPTVSADDLITVCEASSFDSTRTRLLEKLQPHFDGAFDGASARDLVRIFSFDSGKLEVIRLFQDDLRKLDASDKERVLDTFSFDSDRKDARKLLTF